MLPDHTSSIADHWDMYTRTILFQEIDAFSDQDIRKAYYSGAHTMLWLIQKHCSDDVHVMEPLAQIAEEIKTFAPLKV